MKYLVTGLIIMLVLFLYSACVVSSRCSREEEKYEEEIFKRIKKRNDKK